MFLEEIREMGKPSHVPRQTKKDKGKTLVLSVMLLYYPTLYFVFQIAETGILSFFGTGGLTSAGIPGL